MQGNSSEQNRYNRRGLMQAGIKAQFVFRRHKKRIM